MPRDPGEYLWSNYRWQGLGKPDDLITDHALYLALGADKKSRGGAYRDLFPGAPG
jgi:putative transposase